MPTADYMPTQKIALSAYSPKTDNIPTADNMPTNISCQKVCCCAELGGQCSLLSSGYSSSRTSLLDGWLRRRRRWKQDVEEEVEEEKGRH